MIREEKIDKLVEQDMKILLEDNENIARMLTVGFSGYENFTDVELEDELESREN